VKFSHRGTLIQAAAALVVGGIVVGAVAYWSSDKGVHASKSAPKSGSDGCQPASQGAADTTAAQMCVALRNAGLPELLALPTAPAFYGGQATVPDSAPGSYREVKVMYSVGPYMVIVTTIKSGQIKTQEQRQVAGHPAAVVFGTSNGQKLNRLGVSMDAANTGGYYVVDVMKGDGSAIPQDATVTMESAIATKVLPALSGWHAGS